MPTSIWAQSKSGYVGAAGCSSSLCHGGAAENRRQFTIWSRQDVHARSAATLANARSARIAGTLKISDATRSLRCTSCHAPFAEAPAEQPPVKLKPLEAVSCESCHGPAQDWLRAHTRPDYSHADRVQAGLRDLRNLYVRANTCVACHEWVDADILAAGHPELRFELDGMVVSQPRHWHERGEYQGPQAWLVGQAVALRELSWQLAVSKSADEAKLQRWDALLWLLQRIEDDKGTYLKGETAVRTPENFTRVQKAADGLARAAAQPGQASATAQASLRNLARTHSDFRPGKVSVAVQARRAECLVLALERHVLVLDKILREKLEPDLQELFRLAQSPADFDPAAFSRSLDRFSVKL